MTVTGKPNLFVIGAMRAGSTTLNNLLAQHPDIYMSPIKEPMFYVAEGLRRAATTDESRKRANQYVQEGKYRTTELYESLFAGRENESVVGESSHYLYHPEVASIIHADNPEAKVIVSLRNPVDRLYSEYYLYRRRGGLKSSFEHFVFGEYLTIRPREANWTKASSRISKGFYAMLLEPWLQIFGEQNIRVVIFEDFISKPDETVMSIYKWLGVDDEFSPEILKIQQGGVPKYSSILSLLNKRGALKTALKFVIPRQFRLKLRSFVYSKSLKQEVMSPLLYDELRTIYMPEILRLEERLGVSLAVWK